LQEGDEKVDPEGIKNLEELNKFTQLDFMPFDPRQKRTEGKLQAQDGSIFRISKVTNFQRTFKQYALGFPDHAPWIGGAECYPEYVLQQS
jgi:hypothetical protein